MSGRKAAPAKKATRKAAPKKAPAKQAKPREVKTAPEKTRDAADEQVFQTGRNARNSAIPRDSSPHPEGAARKLWQQGWDFQDEALS